MFIVEVIPLVRGSHVDTLSYYTSQDFAPGTIIEVPIRKHTKPAIVLRSRPGSTAKAALRAATFTLRKLPEQDAVSTLPATLIHTAAELTKTVPAEMSAILHALLPKEVREGVITLEPVAPPEQHIVQVDISVFQGTYEDRFRTYRSRIRETFAHRGSVLFVVPTSADVERARSYLERGIENRIVTFSSALTKRKLEKAYTDFHDLSHAKLIITTPSHAFLDRHDITQIIIDQSRSRAYKSRFRPYLDTRHCLKLMAKATSRSLLMGDLLPRTEDEYLRREDFYNTEGEPPKRLTLPSVLTVIEHIQPHTASSTFSLFSEELLKQIKTATSKRKNVFMYAARRGIAPIIACVDCGHIFRCPDSGAPYSLFKTMKNGEEQRWFLAGASGKRIRASDTCGECGSWRLRERGIGIQHIESELKVQFPNTPIILFDHTTATSLRRATQLIGDFYEAKGAILLGTAMAMPYLEKKIPFTVITSLEAARSVPTWRAEEELFALLLNMREKTEEVCYLQTRTAPDEIISLAQSGQTEKFYDEELSLREALKYPPMAEFIHLTFQGTAHSVTQLEQELNEHLATWKPRFYHAPTTTSTKATRYGLIRISRKDWPDQDLVDALRVLPPNVRIEVNPDRII